MIALILYLFVTTIIGYKYWQDEETECIQGKIQPFVVALVTGWIIVPYQIGKLINKYL